MPDDSVRSPLQISLEIQQLNAAHSAGHLSDTAFSGARATLFAELAAASLMKDEQSSPTAAPGPSLPDTVARRPRRYTAWGAVGFTGLFAGGAAVFLGLLVHDISEGAHLPPSLEWTRRFLETPQDRAARVWLHSARSMGVQEAEVLDLRLAMSKHGRYIYKGEVRYLGAWGSVTDSMCAFVADDPTIYASVSPCTPPFSDRYVSFVLYGAERTTEGLSVLNQ